MKFKLLTLLSIIVSISSILCDDDVVFKKYENKGKSAYCGRGTKTSNGTSTEVPGTFCGDGSIAHYWKCIENDQCEWHIETWVLISSSVVILSCCISCCLFCFCKR